MEVILIIAILIIIVVLVYQSQPSVKFKKAEALANEHNYNEALEILNKLIQKHPESPAKIAEIWISKSMINSNREDAVLICREILDKRKKLPAGANINAYAVQQAKASLILAEYEFAKAEEISEFVMKESAFLNLISFIQSSEKAGLENTFTELEKNCFKQLGQVKFREGKSVEKVKNFGTAINIYRKASVYCTKADDIYLSIDAQARVLLCRLKSGEYLEYSEIAVLAKPSKEILHDIHYRYVVSLLKQGKITETEKFIREYSDSFGPYGRELENIIYLYQKKNVYTYLEKLNSDIGLLFEQAYPHKEVKRIYGEIGSQLPLVKSFYPAMAESMIKIRPSLFNRQLSYYIEKKYFGNAINLIVDYPRFWEAPELLKNLAICCFGYINAGKLSEKDFQLLISTLLTAIHSDHVLLKSLEDTSWDDGYTFTLIDSIGSVYDTHEELPENVNYDEVSETNISIGATQTDLLNRIELLLHQKIENHELYERVVEFFQMEKIALEKVIEITTENYLIPAPHFAVRFGLNDTIIEMLESEYDDTEDVYLLEAGVLYIKTDLKTKVHEYGKAKELSGKIISAIKKLDTESLTKFAGMSDLRFIQMYSNLREALEEEACSLVESKIEENGYVSSLLVPIEAVLRLIPKCDRMIHLSGEFINRYCVLMVNSGKIDHCKALQLTTKAYLRDTANLSIIKNLITLIKFNVSNIFADRSEAGPIFDEFDKILKSKSKYFEKHSHEILVERENILDQMKQAGIDIKIFETPISTFGESLLLTSAGDEMRKTLTYMKKLGTKRGMDNDELLKFFSQGI